MYEMFRFFFFFFFNDPATTEIYTLSLHDALPIWFHACDRSKHRPNCNELGNRPNSHRSRADSPVRYSLRSEEHTSELQSHVNLVCRLLLEKKKKKQPLHVNIQTLSSLTSRPHH